MGAGYGYSLYGYGWSVFKRIRMKANHGISLMQSVKVGLKKK
jgi:hypothetical protein